MRRAGRTLSPALGLQVARQLLSALRYVHELRGPDGEQLSIVHCDISPRNVMIGFDGHVKLIDFGLSRARFGDIRTMPGVVSGTVRYLSPEQAMGEPVDARSDLYSLSVVLYELFTGTPVVEPDDGTPVLGRVIRANPAPMRSLRPELPRGLEPVVATGLEKSPDARYATAAAYERALGMAVSEEAVASTDDLGTFMGRTFAYAQHELDGRIAALVGELEASAVLEETPVSLVALNDEEDTVPPGGGFSFQNAATTRLVLE